MLIARLIADSDQSDTGLDAQLANAPEWLIEADAAFEIEQLDERLHELHWGAENDPALLTRILDEVLKPEASLISDSGFELPDVFVSDMDSTMIGQECIDELADYAGLKDKIAHITELAMRGELDFEEALRERVGLLKDLDESAIQQCLDERISPTHGAATLVATLRDHDCRTVLVTGGFHHFADAVAEQLGFERVVGNVLEVADGALTGELAGAITDADTKARVLREEMTKAGNGAISLATGDGANDIPMIEAAHYGFAYRAKPAARAAANGRVDTPDLTAILTLLDIPKSDWVEA
ncbi:phosphoserine phosphatase SerB [Erythrobacter sp. W53]|uniref:phosphoserine phosphatase SerB n=1 Tax=Erythrobacter sp. W53 TaxID=3425947 RepID=UPI003D769C0A